MYGILSKLTTTTLRFNYPLIGPGLEHLKGLVYKLSVDGATSERRDSQEFLFIPDVEADMLTTTVEQSPTDEALLVEASRFSGASSMGSSLRSRPSSTSSPSGVGVMTEILEGGCNCRMCGRGGRQVF